MLSPECEQPITSPPSLITLPLELHEKIFSHLRPFPDRLILRRTHPRLRFHLPRSELPNLGHFQEDSRKKTLAIAELHNPCLIPSDHLPCYVCARMLPVSHFIDKHKLRSRELAGDLCHRRWCIRCGIDEKELSFGQLVTMDGVSRTRCYDCGELCYNGPELRGREFFETVTAKRAEKVRERTVWARRAKNRAAQRIKGHRRHKKSGSSGVGREGIPRSKVHTGQPSGFCKNRVRRPDEWKNEGYRAPHQRKQTNYNWRSCSKKKSRSQIPKYA